MKKLGIILGCVVILVGMMVVPGMAKGGFNEYGYNYQAHIFNGWYHNVAASKAGDPPWTYETLVAAGKSTTWLVMKWSDTWLSNKDRNGDGDLDRGYPTGDPSWTSSAAVGAWVTNHQKGTCIDDGKEHTWTYFVKIVYPPGGVVDTDGDGLDDNTGGSIIWGSYVRIQQVSNDPCYDEHGLFFKVTGPAGFGAYK